MAAGRGLIYVCFYIGNKKILLRECRRHTDRSISSTPDQGGIYPSWGERYLPWLGGGVPTLAGGTYPGTTRVGTPCLDLARVGTP